MIIGCVNPEYEATIPLTICGVDGQIHEQVAIIVYRVGDFQKLNNHFVR